MSAAPPAPPSSPQTLLRVGWMRGAGAEDFEVSLSTSPMHATSEGVEAQRTRKVGARGRHGMRSRRGRRRGLQGRLPRSARRAAQGLPDENEPGAVQIRSAACCSPCYFSDLYCKLLALPCVLCRWLFSCPGLWLLLLI